MSQEMGNIRSFLAASGVFVAFLLLGGVPVTHSADAQPAVIMHTPNMRMADLVGRPDTDILVFSNGHKVHVGSVRKLEAVQKRMRAAKPGSKSSPLLNAHPNANNIKLKIQNSADLSEALKRPNNGDTVQLASKRLVTVGQLKFIKEGEQRLGHTLIPMSERPGLSGQSTAVSKNTTENEWKSILQKSGNDKTVLKSQNDTRVTVGELKQELAKIYNGTSAGSPQKNTTPGRTKKAIPKKKLQAPVSGGAK
jgi:hypothetical protein